MWGFDTGFLIEQEAWEKIMYYARMIQPLYTSWEEYGTDYCAGRLFWSSDFGGEANMRQRQKKYTALSRKKAAAGTTAHGT
jgi:hypothetical protein